MTFRAVLSQRSFFQYWVSYIITEIGSNIQVIAVLWLVHDVTKDPMLLSLAAAATFIPEVVFLLPAGALVDRWNRKHVIIVSEIVGGVAVLAIPLVGLGPYLVHVIVAVGLVEGITRAFSRPARKAIIPSLVDDDELDSGNTLIIVGGRISQLFYIFSGFFIAVFGSFLAFYINSITFFVSVILLLGVPTSCGQVDTETDDEDSTAGVIDSSKETLSDIQRGLRYLLDARVVLAAIVLDLALHSVIAPLSVILPVYTTSVLQGDSVTFGFLLGLFVVGRLIAGGFVRLGESSIMLYRGRIIVFSIFLTGLTYLSFAFTPQLTTGAIMIMVGMMVLFGTFFGIVQIVGNTMLHKVIPDEKRGIVFAVLLSVGAATGPLSIIAAGPALEVFGLHLVIIVQGVLLLAVGAWCTTTPLFSFRDAEVTDTEQPIGVADPGE